MSLLDYLTPSPGRHPVIGSAQVRDMIARIGVTVTIRKRARAQEIDCGCLDPVYRRPDPNCQTCSGSGTIGGWVKRITRAVITERDPHAAFGAGRILGTGGEYERSDALAFMLPGDDVNIEDILIHRKIEFLVKNKVIRYGTHELPMYMRCELWKTPQSEAVISDRV